MNSAYGTYGAYTPVVNTPITDMLAAAGYDNNPGSSPYQVGSGELNIAPAVRSAMFANRPDIWAMRLTPPGPASIGTAAAASNWPPSGASDMAVYVGPIDPAGLEYDDMPTKSSLGTMVAIGFGVLALAGGAYFLGGRRGRR